MCISTVTHCFVSQDCEFLPRLRLWLQSTGDTPLGYRPPLLRGERKDWAWLHDQLCCTTGYNHLLPEPSGHIQSFQFEGEPPPAISPNDGVWLYCPNKYNLKGLDGYLLETKTDTDKAGRATVKVGREFIIRALRDAGEGWRLRVQAEVYHVH